MTSEEERLTKEVARLNGMLMTIGGVLREGRTATRVAVAQNSIIIAQCLVSDALCGKGPHDEA